MHEVRQIGFPILVKAARGGGGKGMKLAHRERELQARLALTAMRRVKGIALGCVVATTHMSCAASAHGSAW